ncbi:hypothetical protein H5P28_15370 [Ruficoccus amylovorans]|uniref:Uncharacterized protein n=1 Tax=Ruficoccus amylovorans TaxID=1804625 RepID=A0A842HJI2_9BACT|nr:hypothetical protein [Ruficoccus amylovorans]MBC2595647.1 hypothetical protein [Ruficoccus amylovorans]
MEASPDPETLSAQERLEAVARLLAGAFLRLQPGPLARRRRATEACENNSESAPISLDKGGGESVHATVNPD